MVILEDLVVDRQDQQEQQAFLLDLQVILEQ
jgi:hypothetical protein